MGDSSNDSKRLIQSFKIQNVNYGITDADGGRIVTGPRRSSMAVVAAASMLSSERYAALRHRWQQHFELVELVTSIGDFR